MSNNQSDDVMSIPELAIKLDIAKATAFRWARRNELPVPVIFIGPRRMVVSRSAVSRLFLEQKSPAMQNSQQVK